MTEGTEAITTIHLAMMAVLAVLAVIAITVGMRFKRSRAKAEREVVERAHEAGVQHPAADTPLPSSIPAEPATSLPKGIHATAAERLGTADEPRPSASEPIAASVATDGTPATISTDADAANTTPSPADGPLTEVKGLGPKVAARLGELGIERVGQLAALDQESAAALDAQLGPFSGRLARDRWIEQARLLASGDRETFERTFGRL